MRRLRLICVLLLIALLVFAAGCSQRAQAGRRAPDFQLTLNNGKKVMLASYRGRVVLLNFWASWCPPCVQETPALEALAREFPQGKVVVLGVSIDQDPVAYETFLAEYHIDYPTARDPSEDVMHHYGTIQIPETYVIAPDGTVARKLVSIADWTSPQMKSYLTGLTRQN